MFARHVLDKHGHGRPFCVSSGAGLLFASALLLILCDCGTAKTLLASSADYKAYRAVRTSVRVEPRLQAANAYLSSQPHGEWYSEVQAWFDEAEAAYYDVRRDNAAGLATYLDILPNGPHAKEARDRLVVFRARTRAAAQDRLHQAAQLTEARLASVAQERLEARDAFTDWFVRLLSIPSWGQLTRDLPGDFIYEWRLQRPQARCDGDRCSKWLSLPYSLPGGGDDTKRVMVLDVILLLEQGALYQARLEGPHLFSRLYEASKSRRVSPLEAESRASAISYALETIGRVTEARFPAARCAVDSVPPVVLERRCDGWTIQVVVADDASTQDSVLVQGSAKK